MNRGMKINLWYILIAVMGVVLLRDIWVQSQTIETIPYSQFETYLENGAIAEVVIGSSTISGTFTTPQEGKTGFLTTPVPPDLAERLSETGVTFSGKVENTWFTTLLSWVLPALLFVGIWLFLIRRMGGGQSMGGMMSIGKSKAKVYVESDTKVTFADVAGVDEAKAELQEVIDFLQNPKEYGSLGARMPKGILLVGPPGTGKTLLARAVAGEAGVPFYSISGSEFVEMFVGVGAARVRDLFEQARKAAPAIIFIDELDALGRARGAGTIQGGNDEREQTLNQLLSELDGFDPSEGVVLLSATNRPEILDPALLRAGRFDRQVLVDRPDRKGRVQILEVHIRKIVLEPGIELDEIAALTTGFSGADLANLVNEAALLATRRRGDVVTMDDFTHAIERIVAGLEKRNRLINPRERKIVAYHEMGHALVSMALPGADTVHKVSIIPRGIGALGYTIQRPTEDRFLMTEDELRNKIAVLMGGRAAEKLIFDHLSTGAADDLARATNIARSMVARYGMDAQLGSVSYETEQGSFLGGRTPGYFERSYSEATAEAMDAAVRDVLREVSEQALEILSENRDILEKAARRLLEVETLDEDALRDLARGLRRGTPGETEVAMNE
ncbi:ATP-dependent zinc metalloprotease FtsH [Maritimibacter fusiformis]|uniref:ATP-dependent zinc metalloprotease FtsH n=1 Tax=Maritimibacter fusiformis TaxID=2603819 RepID=A0A5D0RJU4_9RHOB|nr:ATP-dependent zinc metalloprotease FtsH [Maritimibacter fusiformis]TYB81141.1 ATP-dependent zinc metalloprotease FtsH [Maritimibacter fusiformis]